MCDSMLWTVRCLQECPEILAIQLAGSSEIEERMMLLLKQAPELKHLVGLWDVGTNFCIGTEHQEFPKYPPFFLFQWKHPFLDAGCAC